MINNGASGYRNICWNGITIGVPDSWEATVSGTHHLHFDCDFQGVMEMRWLNASSKNISQLIQSTSRQYQVLTGMELVPEKVPENIQKSLMPLQVSIFAVKNRKAPRLVYLFDEPSATFMMIQFFQKLPESTFWRPIQSLRFPSAEGMFATWSIQDFRLKIPQDYKLMSYTMNAGFSTLHFHGNSTVLHICRLAPAGMRLRGKTLDQILASLLDMKDIQPQRYGSASRIGYFRNPGTLRRIFYRLQRKKPFLAATLRHDSTADRLLGVFMEGIKPLNEQLHQEIAESYEISSGR